ncbi:MAG: hypothetical protein SLAVMIC_00105 [uncultured marine phage]|uniref:Uncharacterized protein n=1 Tax=uncultured marine phage TaxID=707152 RepID=A0A8D9FRV1_9VIRU|nr:MAG: hypothetical protein SLAVMIC_00105 [uncultured marine phage]
MKFLVEYMNYNTKDSKVPTRSVEVSGEEAIEIYFENCDYWKLRDTRELTSDQERSGVPDILTLSRGAQVNRQFSTIDPKGKMRGSKNTSNEYTNLMDNILDSWGGYPRRSESLIMSTDFIRKNIMIPFKGSMVGICPSDDLWWSFKGLNGMVMDDFNRNFLKTFDIDMDDLSNPPSKEDLMKINLDESMRLCKLDTEKTGSRFMGQDGTCKLVNNIWSKLEQGSEVKISLYEFLDFILDPNRNDFRLIRSEDFQSLDKDRYFKKECWSDGKFLTVNKDSYNWFLNKVINDPRYKH